MMLYKRFRKGIVVSLLSSCFYMVMGLLLSNKKLHALCRKGVNKCMGSFKVCLHVHT